MLLFLNSVFIQKYSLWYKNEAATDLATFMDMTLTKEIHSLLYLLFSRLFTDYIFLYTQSIVTPEKF